MSNTIDLIYLDPPFNKKRVFTSPIGSTAQGASFIDIFREEDVKKEWLGLIARDYPKIAEYINGISAIGHISNKNYLCYMAIRLIELHRILKDTGSLFLHCDYTMNSYLRLLLDCIFGENNFRNEIIWKRTSAHSHPNQFGRIHDCLLYYTKSADYTFNKVYSPYTQKQIKEIYRYEDEKGKYASQDLTGGGSNQNDVSWRGYHPAERGMGRNWAIPRKKIIELVGEEQAEALTTLEKLELLDKEGYIRWSQEGTPSYKRYLDDMEGALPQDIWTDISNIGPRAKERVGYPTQKPLSLLNRIIQVTTQAGDVVLDPFCGCATTCVAAEALGRQWVGIDVSAVAYQLVEDRLAKLSIGNSNNKKSAKPQSLGIYGKVIHRTDIPQRTDIDTSIKPKKEIKHWLYGKQEGHCLGCGTHFGYYNLTIDHIVPKSQGGGEDDSNLQLLCGYCNSLKGDRTMAYLLQERKKRNII